MTSGPPSPETQRSASLIQSFSLIASFPLALFGAVGIWRYNVRVGAIELIASALILVNLLVFYLVRRIMIARSVLTFIVLCVLLVLFVTGGIGGTGIFWFFMFPVAAFFLVGKREGIFWIAALSLLSFFALLGSIAEVIHLPYAAIEIQQMFVVLLVISVLVAIYEDRRALDERTIGEKTRELSAILDNLPVGVFLAKVPSGEPLMVNTAGIKLLGRGIDPTAEKDQYAAAYDLVKEDGTRYPTEELPLVQTLRTGERAMKSDIIIRQPNNVQIEVRAVSAPILDADQRMRRAVVVFEDITREKEIDKMKSEFVSVASHQLRTPLTGIKWFTELLLKGKAGAVSDEQKDFLQQISDSNNRMIALVNDLLNVSRIETGRKFSIEKKLTDIVLMIQEVVEEHQIIAAKRGVTLKLGGRWPKELTLNMDGEKMRQVFQNLVSNAIKYSKEANGVVAVALDRSESGRVIFSVKDNGFGIPKPQQEKIFQKFFRAENVLSGFEGTGLGLYIAKAIVEGHGGRIWFESAEGKGTAFFVALPLGDTVMG